MATCAGSACLNVAKSQQSISEQCCDAPLQVQGHVSDKMTETGQYWCISLKHYNICFFPASHLAVCCISEPRFHACQQWKCLFFPTLACVVFFFSLTFSLRPWLSVLTSLSRLRWFSASVTCDGWQGSRVGIGQWHVFGVWLTQVGVAAELLLLGQLEGDRDQKTKQQLSKGSEFSGLSIYTQPPPLPFPSSSWCACPYNLLSCSTANNAHPFAVQRTRPFSLLWDENHAASFLLLLALPQFDLCITHRHHALLTYAHANTTAGAGQSGGPGVWWLRDVP